MYSCFMLIPQGTVRSLALKPILLDEEDDEEEEDAFGTDGAMVDKGGDDQGDANNQEAGGAEFGASGPTNDEDKEWLAMYGDVGARSLAPWASLGGQSAASGSEIGQMSTKSAGGVGVDGSNRPGRSLWSAVTSIVTLNRLGSRVAPAPSAVPGSKKSLLRSNDAATWLVMRRARFQLTRFALPSKGHPP